MARASRRAPGTLSLAVARIIQREVDDQRLTQDAVAQMMDVSQPLVSLMLRGMATFYLDELDDLCRALGLGLGDVVEEAEATR